MIRSLANIQKYGVPHPVPVYCQCCHNDLTVTGGDLGLSKSLYCHERSPRNDLLSCAKLAGEIYRGRFISERDIQRKILEGDLLHYDIRDGSPELAASDNAADAFEAVVEGRHPTKASPLYLWGLTYHLLQLFTKKTPTTDSTPRVREDRRVRIRVQGKVYSEDHCLLVSLDDVINKRNE